MGLLAWEGGNGAWLFTNAVGFANLRYFIRAAVPAYMAATTKLSLTLGIITDISLNKMMDCGRSDKLLNIMSFNTYLDGCDLPATSFAFVSSSHHVVLQTLPGFWPTAPSTPRLLLTSHPSVCPTQGTHQKTPFGSHFLFNSNNLA